ncbi:hypothetical protein [Pseudosporangium ferrugineum]|uniref:Uncharacterized protein n=1 Tax=Pseudosporangium ferrugineum TaxID=439699 RepID=A0A2T0RLD9_9ACTN|nr:hypothetical protein [Pseudosporangium ferrugineum]PRY22004.1 hypothetical protein CLV70_11869 [Pseudosporangium ferrugineum]
MSTATEPPEWIRWPVRVLAIIFVLPFRLAWELLRVLGRFLARWVGRPVAWLWHRLVVVPVTFLWRWLVVVPLSWLVHRLVVVPLSWLWRQRGYLVRPVLFLLRRLIVIPVTWFFTVTAPLWRTLGRVLVWTVETLAGAVAAVARAIYHWVLLPGWRGAGWLLARCYRWLLRPAGRAIAWVWRWTVVPVWRLVAGAGRWVRDTVVRPTGVLARAVLDSVGLRR